MMTDPRKLTFVNEALDRDRARRNLPNDVSLSVAYGIAPKTLSEWRTGKWTKADAVLIEVLFQYADEPADLATTN